MISKASRVSPVDRLAEKFRKLPGVGKKSAYRMAFAVLDMSTEEAKDFAKADAIRAELLAKGIILTDIPGGTKWERK